jgi:Flp pilus assembly protein CpaB
MKQKNLVLMVVAVGCGLVAAFLTTQINANPKVEMVEVFVAAKDLPVGTMLTQGDIPKYVTKKPIPKETLPPQFVVSLEELVGKRLSRQVLKDEPFQPGFLAKGAVVTLPEGKDMVSFGVSAVNAAGGFVGPGSKVDVLARLSIGSKVHVFPLLIDMLVIAVNTHVSYESNAAFPDMSMVSLAVDQEEALLLELAKQRGCQLSLLYRHPGKPRDPSYDIKKIRQLLETTTSKTEFYTTQPLSGNDDPDDQPPAPVTPPPQDKPAGLKVLVARETIAPNTEITADLIEKMFVVKELPKDAAEGALADLRPYIGKALKVGCGEGNTVRESMIGYPTPKVAPPEHFDPPVKPGPQDKAPPVTTPKPTREVHDVAIHTTSGTQINRFEKTESGEWKLVKVLTPQDAARLARESTGTARPPEPRPDSQPDSRPEPLDGKKID